jgi:diguanylate cyclase (GGDEF)-like protein
MMQEKELRELWHLGVSAGGSVAKLESILARLPKSVDGPAAFLEFEELFDSLKPLPELSLDCLVQSVPVRLLDHELLNTPGRVFQLPEPNDRFSALVVDPVTVLVCNGVRSEKHGCFDEWLAVTRRYLARRRSLREERRLRRWLRVERELLELATTHDSFSWYRKLARSLCLVANADSATVIEVNGKQVRAAASFTRLGLGPIEPKADPVTDAVLKLGQTVIVGSTSERLARPSIQKLFPRQVRYESALAVPVKSVNGEIIAILSVHSVIPYRFGNEESEVLESLAAIAALVIGRWRRPRMAGILASEEDFAQAVLNSLDTGLCLTDGHGTVLYHNQAYQGKGDTRVIELERRSLEASSASSGNVLAHVVESYSYGAESSYSVLKVENWAASIHADISHIDPLTGLLNRKGFMNIARHSIAEMPADSVALIVVDIDQLRSINRKCSHQVGDSVLAEIADRIVVATRPTDTCARIGGDEFAVLCPNAGKSAKTIARRLAAAVASAPVAILGQSINVTVSYGWASTRRGLADLDALISKAEASLRADKFDRHRVDAVKIQRIEATGIELELGPDLAKAVRGDDAGGHLVIDYQPIYDTGRGIVSVEALVRWQHPERGLISPARFLPLATRYRMIGQIDEWVRTTACGFLANLKQMGLATDVSIALNVSGLDLNDARLVSGLVGLVDGLGLNRSDVVIELTESELAQPLMSQIAKLMKRIKGEGFRIALDDFGVGTSSLTHLELIPVDAVKIDRQFVERIGEPGGAKLILALVALAQSLGVEVIAEGVSSAEMVHELNNLGIQLQQGFYLAKPMCGRDLFNLLLKKPQRVGE